MGESKLYKNGKAGIVDLATDLKKHVEADYLRQEFSLISRKLPLDLPDIEYWRNLIDQHQNLDKVFSSIVIPMVCTYTSEVCRKYSSETKEYLNEFNDECKGLEHDFCQHKIKTNIEVMLMLLPVYSKDELNEELDKRLKAMQQI